MATVMVRKTRAEVKRILQKLPDIIGGKAPDPSGIATALLTRVGMEALSRIKQAFIVKARGGTDDAGDRWQPLSPKTIAYSKTRQRGRGGRTKTEKKRDTHPSQALNKRQQERWWEVYRRQLAVYKGNKKHAAAVAWLVLKAEGATTLVDKYGHRQVEILRDTGLLLNSLSPGATTPESIFRVGKGEVIVGTNRKGAAAHHYGVPGKLPRRRLWPAVNRWPATWWRGITNQIKQGILDITELIVRRPS